MVMSRALPVQRVHQEEDVMQTSSIVGAAAVLLALIVSGATHAKEPTVSDQKAIIDLHHQFMSAWNKGDAEAVARCLAEDGVRVGGGGDIARGRAEIRAEFARLFGGPFRGATARFVGDGEVRMLGSDYALWQGPIEVSLPDKPGPMKGYAVDVMVRRGGAWLILETHPKLYPPPPPSSR